jgi:hypothetical protein
MGYGSFWEGTVMFFAPLAPTLKGMESFDTLIAIVILGLIAYVLIRGHRRYELVRMETENLIRRYMIYRGKRHRTLSKARLPKGTREEILKSISHSWHIFKAYHSQMRELLERNYRWLRMGFVVGCILLVLNMVREGIAGLVITELPSGFFIGLAQSLPYYLLVVVGIALLRIQKEELYSAPSPQFGPALEALFADFDREDPRLAEEFEPLEEKD